MNATDVDSGLWDEKQAGRFLGVTPAGMRGWRAKGCGPPFIKLNRLVRYIPGAVRGWVQEQAEGNRHRPAAEVGHRG